MAFADTVASVLADIDSQQEASIAQLYKQLKNAIAVARASGLAMVSYTLPSGVSRQLEITEATAALKALSDLLATEQGGVVFQPAEFRR